MNKIVIIFLFMMLSVILLSVNAAAQNTQKNSVYKFKDFLIHATDTMKIDFIVKGTTVKPRNSINDTLYEDDRYLILGNADKLGYYGTYGIFRKYRMPYKFSDFKVEIYKGRLAPPDFNTDLPAYMFRTQIKNQCKSEGINFAGHFTIAHWGCGSSCEEIAIIDRINGKIFYSNLIKLSKSAFFSFKCQATSKMLVMNDWLLGIYKGYIYCSDQWNLEIAKWDDKKFKFF